MGSYLASDMELPNVSRLLMMAFHVPAEAGRRPA